MAVTSEIKAGTAHAAYANVKETFPESTTPTSGTITILAENLRNIIGTGTVFLTDFNVGDYIWIQGADEIRKIESIASDLEMTLQHAATAVAGDTFKCVKPVGYSTISWANDSTGISNINGIPFPASMSGSYDGVPSKKVLLIDSTVGGGTVNIMAE